MVMGWSGDQRREGGAGTQGRVAFREGQAAAVAMHVPREEVRGPVRGIRSWSWREAAVWRCFRGKGWDCCAEDPWLLLNREVTFPQGLKALLTVACRRIRPGRNVGMRLGSYYHNPKKKVYKSCQIITSECGRSYICVKFQSSYSIIKTYI